MTPANDSPNGSSPRQADKRLMTRAEAAAYCGFRPSAFSAHVASGNLPPAIATLRRWDRAALDAHFDKLSGIAANDNAPAADPYLEWKRAQ